jgi:hypothetical protein
MTASITKGSGSSWTITISNGSQSFTTVQTYSGPGSSVEWIEEAPAVAHVDVLAERGQGGASWAVGSRTAASLIPRINDDRASCRIRPGGSTRPGDRRSD